jgi:hypothetical protein
MNLNNMPVFKELNDELENIKNIIIKKETLLSEHIVNYLNRNLPHFERFSLFASEIKSSSFIICDRELLRFAITIDQTLATVRAACNRLGDSTPIYYLDVILDTQRDAFALEHRINNDIWANFLEFNNEIFEFEKSIFKINEMVYTNLEALRDIISEIFTDEYYEVKRQLPSKISKVRNFTDRLENYMRCNTLHSVENTIVSEMPNNGIIIRHSSYSADSYAKFKYSNGSIKNVNRHNIVFNTPDDIKHGIMYRNRNILKKGKK